ncbi:MAG: hypothetical protein QY322_01310 [bacterium]|nr:MAG: hypothetical protein QY322_01310 [bacterium]
MRENRTGGQVDVGGASYDRRRILTDKEIFIDGERARLVEIKNKLGGGSFGMLVYNDGRLTKGSIVTRRVQYEVPERQRVFRSGSTTIVLSSDPVTS